MAALTAAAAMPSAAFEPENRSRMVSFTDPVPPKCLCPRACSHCRSSPGRDRFPRRRQGLPSALPASSLARRRFLRRSAKGVSNAPGNHRPKKGAAARSSCPPGRAAERADLVTELDGTPVRDAADLAAQAGAAEGSAKSPNSPLSRPRRRGDGARREGREPAARYSSRNQASRNTSA
jgi:hypothetical protein